VGRLRWVDEPRTNRKTKLGVAELEIKGRGKVVPVHNYFSTTLCRRKADWMYRSTFS
jgi:hypothetical protein